MATKIEDIRKGDIIEVAQDTEAYDSATRRWFPVRDVQSWVVVSVSAPRPHHRVEGAVSVDVRVQTLANAEGVRAGRSTPCVWPQTWSSAFPEFTYRKVA